VIDFSSVICITYYSGPLGKTKHFNLHLDKLDVAADLVIDVTKKNYPDFNIPYHSRWRHFKKGSVEELSAHWPCGQKVRCLCLFIDLNRAHLFHVFNGNQEKARRMIDLVTVSVLLDAGSGPAWKYVDSQGNVGTRSEGIAWATLDMVSDYPVLPPPTAC